MAIPRVQWKTRTSWRAKLHKPQRPKLVPISDGMARRFGQGIMLIPTAMEVDAMIRKIPLGQVSTLADIRKRLAKWHNVDLTCPLVTGIFLRIVAGAAEEDWLEGKQDITPYWRVVGEDGRLNAKFPGGVATQGFRLKQEGRTILNDRVLLVRPSEPAA